MTPPMSKLKTILILGSVCFAYVIWGLTRSIHPTLYPAEAEKKGATPSQYGFVFGIVNIAGFIAAPIFAQFGKRIIPKLLYNVGSLVMGLSTISFGLLQYTDDTALFLGMSYFLRLLEGIATAALSTAVLSILMIMYPIKVATISGTTEMFFGVGYMIGPVVGAALYSVGSFGFPFYIIGSFWLFITVAQAILLPNKAEKEPAESSPVNIESKSLSALEVVKTPALMLVAIDNFFCFCGVGMIESMLEPHMSGAAKAMQMEVASAFLIFGLCYMLSTPVLGWLIDRTGQPASAAFIGNLLLVTSFLLIGPAPFLAVSPNTSLIYGMMATFGVGTGMLCVSTLSRCHKLAMAMGFEDDIGTFMFVAAIWSSSCQLGSFVGASAGGILVDAMGFRNTTTVLFAIYLLMIVMDLIIIVRQRKVAQTSLIEPANICKV